MIDNRGGTLAAIALIERGASLTEENQNGWTPLHCACYYSHTATAVDLIERANENEKDQDGRTPLFRACIFSHSATAILLLEHETVGVNDRDNSGRTPSYLACYHCTADVILRMIRHGAIVSALSYSASVIDPQSQRSRHAQSKLPTSERTTGGGARTMPCSCRASETWWMWSMGLDLRPLW